MQIVGLSPDLPANLKLATEKHKLKYRLLSDSDARAIKAMGLAFRVADGVNARLRRFGIDIEKASGRRHHLLPVPAVYLLDREGRVAFSYVNPNYRVRCDPQAILAAAARLIKPKPKAL